MLASGCGSAEAPASSDGGRPPATVEVLTLVPRPLRNVVQIPGQLISAASVVIKAEREGVLVGVAFDEGSPVKKGEVLFRLRDDEERARLNEAEAELALAKAVHTRTKTLVTRDVASEAELERTAAERDVAAARVTRAEVDLSRMTLRAPFDGVLGELLVAPGERLREQTTMVRIDAVDRLQLVFGLPETAIPLVRVGAPVVIRVAPYPDETFPGEIYFVSPSVDPETRRVGVKAWVPNPERRLHPGLFAQAEAEIARRDDALLVPESALVHGLEGTRVWRLDADDRAQAADVELGLRQEGWVEVVRGLSPGDRVVTAGVHKVSEGSRVQAVESTEPPVAPLAGTHGEADAS